MNEKNKVRSTGGLFFRKSKRQRTDTEGPQQSTPSENTTSSAMESAPHTRTKTTPLLIRFFDPQIHAQDPRGRRLDEIIAWPDEYLENSHNYIQMLFPLPEGSPFNMAAPIIDREIMEAFRSRADLRTSLRKAFQRLLQFYGFAVREVSVEDGSDGDQKGSKEPEAEEEGGNDADAANTPGKAVTHAPSISITSNERPATIALDDDVDTHDPTKIESDMSTQPGLLPPIEVIQGHNFRDAARNWVVRFDHNHLRITRILRSLRVLGLEKEAQGFFRALQDVFRSTGRISERSLMYWTRAVERPLYIAPDDERIGWLKTWVNEQKQPADQGEKSGPNQADAEKEAED